MFGDVVDASIRFATRRWYTVPLSVLVHTAVVVAAVVIPLTATDVLPMPPVISADGLVQDARVLRSIPPLDQAALVAVRQWEFTRPLLNGTPVPVIMTVTVEFRLR